MEALSTTVLVPAAAGATLIAPVIAQELSAVDTGFSGARGGNFILYCGILSWGHGCHHGLLQMI